MNKKLAIVLIVVAFVIGAIGGAWAMRIFYNSFMLRFASSGETSKIVNDVTALTWIRKNDVTNAVEFLENDLDSSLMYFSILVNDVPKSKIDPKDLKSLRMAKSYRDKFPYTNEDVEISQTISKRFLLLDVKTNK